MGSGFIGAAKVRVAAYSDGATFESRPFRYVENATEFTFGFSEEKKELPDAASVSGGIDSSLTRISSIDGSIALRHLTAENLALALWGKTSLLPITAVVGEAGYKIVPKMFIPTKRLINISIAPVLKKGATVIAPADYTVTPGGIQIADTISTATVISGDPITVDYTPLASMDVQALVRAAPDVSIHIEGVNKVDQKYYVGKFYKCKLGVAQNVSMIGEDFATLTISFTPQKDETIIGTDKSQYFYLEPAV